MKMNQEFSITSVKKLSIDEFLKANGFEANTDESDIVGFKVGLKGRDLSARQPTVRSAEASQEHNDTSLFHP